MILQNASRHEFFIYKIMVLTVLVFVTRFSIAQHLTNSVSKEIDTSLAKQIITDNFSATEDDTKTATGSAAYFKTNQEIIVKMKLDTVQYDIAWLKFLSGASKNYVFGEDGLKLANAGYNLSFTTTNNVAVQHNVVGLLSTNQTDTFILNVSSASSSSYTLSFESLSQIPTSKWVLLKDNYNNSWTDLRVNSNYAFAINNNLSATFGNRFLLIITDVFYPLPVSITAFMGERKAQVNILNWQVAQEKNINYYQIQRSVNGVDFNDIGVVKAQNNSIATTYMFKDETAVGIDVAYYRLKIIEQNGEYNYSNTLVIHDAKQAVTNIKVYPVPTKDWINIETQEEVLAIKIHDVSGRIVAKAIGENKLDISQLQTGVYVMELVTNEGITTHKIIKE